LPPPLILKLQLPDDAPIAFGGSSTAAVDEHETVSECFFETINDWIVHSNGYANVAFLTYADSFSIGRIAAFGQSMKPHLLNSPASKAFTKSDVDIGIKMVLHERSCFG
jgi:hypothetical protein